MYHTTPGKIVALKNYFKLNPDGRINTGMWCDVRWNKEQFYSWFRKCLHIKTGGQELTVNDIQLQRDSRIINEYAKGINRRGTGILSSVRMQRRYPHINNNF